MNQYLADTTVFIEHFHQNPSATSFLKDHHPNISTVSKAELIIGAKDKNVLQTIVKTCSVFPESKIDERVATLAIELMESYYLSHHLLFLDALIAATAITRNLILVTGNIKHFSFIPNLNLKNWKDFEKAYNQARA